MVEKYLDELMAWLMGEVGEKEENTLRRIK